MTGHHMTPEEYAEYCRLINEAMALNPKIEELQAQQMKLIAESGEINERALLRARDPDAIRRAGLRSKP